MQFKTVVILDIDNTLFDWVEVWHRSFSAMLDELVQTSGVEREVLIGDFKVVFTRHGTSEYAFAIEELASLRARHPDGDLAAIYGSAIRAFRAARTVALTLYPGVEETLQTLQGIGCLLIGYTESMAYYSHSRMRAMGLDQILDFVYSPADHDHPQEMSAELIGVYRAEACALRRTVHRYTPSGAMKPNAGVLRQIIRDVGVAPEKAVYVGDSLAKDIAMAQEAGVSDAWAKYGAAQVRPEFELLRRVTHWTAAAVEREQAVSLEQVNPTVTLSGSLAELLPAFRFGRYRDAAADGE